MRINYALAFVFLIGVVLVFPFSEAKKDPPKIKPSKSIWDRTVMRNVKMTCDATGAKPLTYQWLKNGNPIPKQPNKNYLRLRNLSLAESGNYTCIVSNSYGTVKKKHTLRVTDPPKIKPSKSIWVRAVMRNVKMTCDATGAKPLTYQWLKNGNPIPKQPNKNYLRLRNLTLAESGNYTCIVSNIFGTVKRTHTLRVFEPLEFKRQKTPYWRHTVRARKDVTLSCEVKGTVTKPVTYKWFRPIPKHAKQRKLSTKTGSLRLRSLTQADSGNYTCIVSNPYGTVKRTHSVIVLGPPEFTHKRTYSRYHGVTLNVKWICKAKGTNPLKYQWLKDGKPIPDRVLQKDLRTNTSYLRLRDLTLADSGKYTCIVKNIDGQNERNYTLVVYHERLPLLILSTTPENITASLSSTVNLRCIVTGYHHSEWKLWHQIPLNYEKLDMNNDTNYKEASFSSFKNIYTGNKEIFGKEIQIQNITEKQFGLYTCVASDSRGTAYRSAFVIKRQSNSVKGQKSPKFVTEPRKTVIVWPKFSSKELLNCQAYGASPMTYTWLKDNKSIIPQNGSSELSLTNLKPIDSGDYKCIVANKYGTIWHTFTVYVVGKAFSKPTLPETFPNTEVQLGENARMAGCVYNLTTSLFYFRWYKWPIATTPKQINYSSTSKTLMENTQKNQKKITIESDGYQIYSYLNFVNVTANDFGLYSCCVENKFGITCASTYLKQAAAPKSDNVYD